MPTLAARTDAEGGFGVTYFELLAHSAQGSDVVVRAITDARSIYFELLAHRARGSDVVVTLREREACSLIAPPIVGRAINRRSQLA
jgi:hypothetical protein